jgi:hypothetical protein
VFAAKSPLAHIILEIMEIAMCLSTFNDQVFEQIEELKMIAPFTDKEIQRLLLIFQKLDTNHSGEPQPCCSALQP